MKKVKGFLFTVETKHASVIHHHPEEIFFVVRQNCQNSLVSFVYQIKKSIFEIVEFHASLPYMVLCIYAQH